MAQLEKQNFSEKKFATVTVDNEALYDFSHSDVDVESLNRVLALVIFSLMASLCLNEEPNADGTECETILVQYP